MFRVRTKLEATATNVLRPYPNEKLSKNFPEATFVTVSVGARTEIQQNQYKF
jgi:hypothetical protein